VRACVGGGGAPLVEKLGVDDLEEHSVQDGNVRTQHTMIEDASSSFPTPPPPYHGVFTKNGKMS
jgi:hypothetical protein